MLTMAMSRPWDERGRFGEDLGGGGATDAGVSFVRDVAAGCIDAGNGAGIAVTVAVGSDITPA